jgi:uncharacterized membrane protein YkoI
MTQRSALFIAAGLTAFVLVVLGGLDTALAPPPPVPLIAPTAPADPTTGANSAAPFPQAVYQQALQEARAQLDEANRRLALANEQLHQAQAPSAPLPPAATATPAPPAYPVSPLAAAQAALALAPGATLITRPDLVSYQGTAAYEVRLDRGTVYIDAASGQILYNGLAPAIQAPAPGAAQARGDYEHENDEDDGDD